MVVSFTPNIGLAKPDLSELAKDWAVGNKLAEDNNNILTTKMTFTPVSYTPVLTLAGVVQANGTAPIVSGAYYEYNGWIYGTFVYVRGTGVSGITGSTNVLGISLPVPVSGAYHRIGGSFTSQPGDCDILGEGYYLTFLDVAKSGGGAIDCVFNAGTYYARMYCEQTPGVPFILDGNNGLFAPGDGFSTNFLYKKA